MHVDLQAPSSRQPRLAEAQRIIESCVHCGLCTSACPTYEMLDHELDSPRGRIYLIREMLQGGPVGDTTREHLDRCLGCRACETVCPSGVEYGHLIDLGREEVEHRAPRPAAQRWWRRALRWGLSDTRLVRLGLSAAWAVKPLLPARLRQQLPPQPKRPVWPKARCTRRVLTLQGCVQPALTPAHDASLAALLDRFGVSLVTAPRTGCCGALAQHLGGGGQAADAARRNIDAWWPLIEQGAEAIILGSSGCGAMVKDYGHLLRGDPAYAARAQRVSELMRDPAELIAALWQRQPLDLLPLPAGEEALAFHPPCTQQHGLRFKGTVEALLQRAGYRLTPVEEKHMCCGSAGTYSILQPALANRFRDRKLGHLLAGQPRRIASANIGCILHLQTASPVPIQHWAELLASRLLPSEGDEA